MKKFPCCLLGCFYLILVLGGACSAKDVKQGQPPFWGVALEGYPVTDQMLEQAEKGTGLFPELVVFFLQWPSHPVSEGFPSDTLERIWKNGSLPCITWEPMFYNGSEEITIPHQQVLSGRYDIYLNAFAQQARSWGRPFILRFAHEMNIQRYHWGTQSNQYGPQSPEIYRAMHAYVFEIFQKAGAQNVLWAFCPNAESVPNTSYDKTASWNRLSNYYPGDGFVDILGMDGYNWGTTQTMERNRWTSSWKSFEEIFSLARKELLSLGASKPLFVFETASANEGGDKGVWIREAFSTTREWKITGLAWFHSNKEVDWRFSGVKGLVGMWQNQGVKGRAQLWAERFLQNRQTQRQY